MKKTTKKKTGTKKVKKVSKKAILVLTKRKFDYFMKKIAAI